MCEITVAAVPENLDTVLDFINRHLELAGCSLKIITQLNLAVEEIFVNIARYAYTPQTGDACIQYHMILQPRQIQITFTDSGYPYNPLKKKDPDITQNAETREIGGLGIFMAKKLSDDITYNFINGRNILTLKKNIEN